MSNIDIKAENLSKAYQLGEIGTGTFSRDLERWYARISGKEDDVNIKLMLQTASFIAQYL